MICLHSASVFVFNSDLQIYSPKLTICLRTRMWILVSWTLWIVWVHGDLKWREHLRKRSPKKQSWAKRTYLENSSPTFAKTSWNICWSEAVCMHARCSMQWWWIIDSKPFHPRPLPTPLLYQAGIFVWGNISSKGKAWEQSYRFCRIVIYTIMTMHVYTK